MNNILKSRFIDTKIDLINAGELCNYEIEQIYCIPIMIHNIPYFICEARKIEKESEDNTK
jgi:hypothetical protein